ncbi:PRTRC system protein F [Ralstonia sp. UBA689]|uniref:PRTRC system protein F n=1 Tax=Ralstonia sp. UBA689 TaxID=1947373 RepID=UPI0025EE0751|nr:PRTRC system protein F [Ralstonia sp. UBA689]
MSALSLPRLNGIPLSHVCKGGGQAWHAPALLALLDAGALTLEDAQPKPNSAAALLKRTLQRHWNEITAGERLLVWNLHARSMYSDWLRQPEQPQRLWLFIGDESDQPHAVPQLYIGHAFERLESVRQGLGQTVLAVLYDALSHLPNVLTPQESFYHASWVHWHGTDDEEEAIEWMFGEGEYKTREEAAEAYEGPTRLDFFERVPEWAVHPERVLTDRQVRIAARKDALAAQVVGAVDDIWRHALATDAAGGYADCSTRDAEGDSICWTAVLIWHPDDLTLRLADDFLQQVCQAEYTDAATVKALPIDSHDAAQWLQQMRANGQLARRVETLLDLLAAQNPLRQQIRVQ